MNREQIAALPPMTGLVAGSQAQSKIISNKRTGYMIYTIEGAVTLAGGPKTSIFNGGSIVSLLDYIGFSDAGDDRAYWPALSLLAYSQRLTFGGTPGFGVTPNLRLTSLADGVYPLRETVVLPFAGLGPQGSSAPWETCHLQPDPKQDSWGWVIPNLNTAKLVAGAGTATITTPVTVSVTQVFDEDIQKLPFFIPKFRWIQQSVPGAVQNLPFYIKATKAMRGIQFTAIDSVAGVVSDIITSVRLLDDAPDGMYIGPNNIGWKELLRWEAFRLGLAPFLGNSAAGVPTVQDGMGSYYHNWQNGGRLSNIYNPRNAGNNLRLEVTGLPSVVGGGSAAVYAAIIELETIPGKTNIPNGPDGRPIFTY